MKPPLISRALLTKQNAKWVHYMAGRPQPNALPTYYLVAPWEGGLLVMQDKSSSPDGATGPQVCLAIISAETLTVLRAARAPVELKP